MAWLVPSSQNTIVNLTSNDDAFIAPQVLINPAAGYGIYGSGSGQRALVHGTVVSQNNDTISLSQGTDQRIDVKPDGLIQALGSATALAIGNGFIENAGIISSTEDRGVLSGVFGGNTTIINSGTLEGLTDGIQVLSGTSTITNSGTIFGGIFSYSGSNGVDTVINTGRVTGAISLDAGDDSYAGAAGHLSGVLTCGAGNDAASGGTDSDNFKGEADNDTLNGGVGSDLLDGGSGNDTLIGGAGKDRHTGGANNDFFVFNTALNASTNVDTITDFSHVNDTIRLENAIFKALTHVGTLSTLFFFQGAHAHDANDHVVYNKANGALYYDDDGTGAHAQVLFAVLQSKPVNVASGDFVVI